MNERIQELCKQAGGISYDDDNEIMNPMLVGKQVEKFAELIVRECIDILDDEDDGEDTGRSVRIAMIRIKKHFGVE